MPIDVDSSFLKHTNQALANEIEIDIELMGIIWGPNSIALVTGYLWSS